MISFRLTLAGSSYTPGARHRAADADQARPAVLLAAECGEPLPAVGDDPRTSAIVSTLLTIGGQAERSTDAGKGGFSAATRRFPSRELISEVSRRRCTPPRRGGPSRRGRSRAQDVLPKKALRVRLGDRLVHDPRLATNSPRM